MSGGSTTSTRRGGSSTSSAGAAAARAAAAASASTAAAVPSLPAELASLAPSKGAGGKGARQTSPPGAAGSSTGQGTTTTATAIPAATLQRLGLSGTTAGPLSPAAAGSPTLLPSPVASTASSSSPPATTSDPDHPLLALQAILQQACDDATERCTILAQYRERLLAAPFPAAAPPHATRPRKAAPASGSRRASSIASNASASATPAVSNTHSKQKATAQQQSSASQSTTSSKLSPPLPLHQQPGGNTTSTTTSRSRQPTPLNASNLSTNNAINTSSSLSTQTSAPTRGTKRARADSGSDSSLSPQSATSNSSAEPLAAQRQATSAHPVVANTNGASASRHGSPASTSASVSGAVPTSSLGPTSTKLSRTAGSSSHSQASRDSNVGQAAAAGNASSKEGTTAAPSPVPSTSTSSSIGGGSTAPPPIAIAPAPASAPKDTTANTSTTSGKPAPGSKDALAAIAGLGAPLPNLPGFTRKKKQPIPPEKQASPAPTTSRQGSPTNDHSQPYQHFSASTSSSSSSSTSRLPPPPSSLPPRPLSLPPKPSTSYGAPTTSSSHYRRESSGNGPTAVPNGWAQEKQRESGREQDRERERITERDRNQDRDSTTRRATSDRDAREKERGRDQKRDSTNRCDRDSDRENERRRNDGGETSRGRRERSMSKGRESDTWLHGQNSRSRGALPAEEKRSSSSFTARDKENKRLSTSSTSTSAADRSAGNLSIPEVRIVENSPSTKSATLPTLESQPPSTAVSESDASGSPNPMNVITSADEMTATAREGHEDAEWQPPAPPEKDAPPPPPPLSREQVSSTSTSDEEPLLQIETKQEKPDKHVTVASSATAPSDADPASKPVSTSQPRKTLPPPSSSSMATSAQVEEISPLPSAKPPSVAALIPRAAAIVADANAQVARPSTPLGRKKLPASVTAAASRRGSPAPGALDKTKTSSFPANSAASTGAAIDASAAADGSAQSQIPQANGSITSADAEAAALAKQKRKEEKRKRKHASLLETGTPAASPGRANGSSVNQPNGSPAIKINGISADSMTRTDSNAPTKMRRIDSTTSMDSTEKGGLKLKLGGITISRPKSVSPADSSGSNVKKGPSVPGVADDFSLPTRTLVPAAPPLQIPTPTPSKQSDINEDLDNSKPASQVPYSSFANWYNDFLRSFGDDDLAFLAPKQEDSSVYDVPALGPHYLDTWQIMDAELSGEQMEGPQPSTALLPPALRRFKSSNLSDADLAAENVYLGPLGERFMSAFRSTRDIQSVMEELFNASQRAEIEADKSMALEMPDSARTIPDTIAAIDKRASGADFVNPLQTSPQLFSAAVFNDPSVLANTPSIKEMDAVDFESRLTRELSFIGVIPLPTRQAVVPTKSSKKGADGSSTALDLSSSVDWTSRADDEISTALRACQRQLYKQSEENNKRKERLVSIVRQRMAYQEYEHLRDGLEAVIEAAWGKRQRAAQRKAQKDRKDKDKKGDREKDKDKLEAASLAQSIAALNTPQPHTASLIAALTKRRSLIDNFRHLFPSNTYILPQDSIYEDKIKE